MPRLPSGDDFFAKCGTITYAVNNPDPTIFSSFRNLNSVAHSNPTFEVYSTDSSKVEFMTPPYQALFTFSLSLTFDAYP